MAHHIVFIHGIGDAALKVSESFERNISSETVHSDIRIHAFFWKNLVSKKEEQIKKKLGRFPARELMILLNINLKENIENYLILQLRRHLIGYFGDAVFYLSENSRKVKSQFENALFEIAKKDKTAKISIVAHSLGSVIAFDALCEKRIREQIKKKRLVIENLFTVGSPLALFLLRSETNINASLPITGKWLNIYDRRDMIASPLSPFFNQCRDFSVKVENSNPLTVHANYFNDAVVLNEILRTIM